jgi:putative phosphoribosyl transferase
MEAGRLLALQLAHYMKQRMLLILALPRGGVPVGYEVARAIGAPLDVFVVRKLSVPGHAELAMGAIATGGVLVLQERRIAMLQIPPELINKIVMREMQELERRERLYRGSRPPLEVRDRTVILVDDGLATGSSMRAAVEALRQLAPRRIVVAVPTAAQATCDEFQPKWMRSYMRGHARAFPRHRRVVRGFHANHG